MVLCIFFSPLKTRCASSKSIIIQYVLYIMGFYGRKEKFVLPAAEQA